MNRSDYSSHVHTSSAHIVSFLNALSSFSLSQLVLLLLELHEFSIFFLVLDTRCDIRKVDDFYTKKVMLEYEG